MFWPYLFLSFVAIILFRLGFWFAGGFTALALLLLVLFDHRRMSARWLVFALMGIPLGALLFLARAPLITPQNSFKNSGEAMVAGVSRKSVTLVTDAGVRFRLTGLKKEELPAKYARVRYQCEVVEMPTTSFSAFERLSGTQHWCRKQSLSTVAPPTGFLVHYRSSVLQYLTARFSAVTGKADSHTLIAAFVLGDTDDLSAAELDAFRDMGLMHLFAVSGLNIALLFGMIYLPFRFAGLGSLGSAIGYGVATGFLLLLDFPVPLLRAWLFMTLTLAMKLLDRRIGALTLLSMTAVIVELLFPLSTFTMSFLLSFGVTAAILMLYEPVYFCFAQGSRWANLIAGHVSLTLAAGLPAMALSFALFGNASPLSLLYNLVLVPFSGLYLFASLIYLVFEPARYAIQWLDRLYFSAASLHAQYVQSRFPVADAQWQKYAISLMLLSLVLLLFLAWRKHLWTARRRIYFALPLLFAVLCVPYLLAQYPKSALYALPNQVWYYQKGTLQIEGTRLFADSADPKLCFPVKVRSADATLKLRAKPAEILRLDTQCILFAGSLHPENWQSDALKNCKGIDLFASRKLGAAADEWQKLFAAFGFRGNVSLRKYFTWYADAPLACAKSERL